MNLLKLIVEVLNETNGQLATATSNLHLAEMKMDQSKEDFISWSVQAARMFDNVKDIRVFIKNEFAKKYSGNQAAGA